MTRMLSSYLSGRWHTADDEGTPVADASTGQAVARVSSTGADVGAAVEHARSVGGPALRALTYPERAALVKAVVGVLTEGKDELYALSTHTGATRRDSAVDIDGGIGTMAVFASKARKELPSGRVWVDGEVEVLGKEGTFVGQHLLTPLTGVAVQVNAYNFPVWGPAEKLAPALLAGLPTLIKPATQSAYLTEAAVRMIVESGVLPEGALQLVCGGARDLSDHLGGQDLLSFTGSADTAARLRSHPAVVQRSMRFNGEADSLNASLLGPDPSAEELALFVKQVVREMTVKAGQKCTAIRRVLVPSALVGEVTDAISAQLAKVVVGHPDDPATTMGPVVSLDQRDDVRRAVKALAETGVLAFGDPDKVDVAGADAVSGAFLSPLLVRCEDSSAAAPHEVEAFGPVSTVIAYDGPAEALSLLARGGGSLVASLVSSDSAFVDEIVLGGAAHHGRFLVLDPSCAAESTGHGTPMPQLVHGGPGRAGGGEEEGGMRAVAHHLQRTAVQGHPEVLARLGSL